MRRLLLLGLALAGCGGPPPPSLRPISGALHLTLDAAGPSWVVFAREGSDAFQVVSVAPGARTTLAWREEVDRVREWRLPFGPTRHPEYRIIVVDGAAPRPEPRRGGMDAFHVAGNAALLAYFAIPLDGERELAASLRRPADFEAEVLDPEGKPVAGATLTCIPTPAYRFLDGVRNETVAPLHRPWPPTYRVLEHGAPGETQPVKRTIAKTDERGRARLEAFVGWVGISEKDEAFVLPRSVLAMPETRSARFSVSPDGPRVRMSAEGLPGRDFSMGQRAVLVEGDWPVPPGTPPHRWAEKVPFVHGALEEFRTPCRDLTIASLSPAHRLKEGGKVEGLKPGETRRLRVVFEEIPHRLVEGEAVLEHREAAGREYCAVELWESGGAGRLVDALGARRGPGVPASGRMPFVFHAEGEGPFDVVVKTGSYPWTVMRGVKAPAEGLEIRLAPDGPNLPVEMVAKRADGSPAAGWVVGSWPHRDLTSAFLSGTNASGKAGLNTFAVRGESGSALLRDVRLEAGKPAPTLEVVLRPGSTLSGRVVGPDGAVVPGVWVHLAWPGHLRQPNAHRWLADCTDEAGRFSISQVPPGPWRLYARGTGIPLGEAFEVPSEAPLDLGDRRLPWRD